MKSEENGIDIDNQSKIMGIRALKNGHKTRYIIYNATNISINPYEKLKIIGEVWNCGVNGISVICIGIAQITEYRNNIQDVNFTSWKKIVADPQGSFGIKNYEGNNSLIYNVKCH